MTDADVIAAMRQSDAPGVVSEIWLYDRLCEPGTLSHPPILEALRRLELKGDIVRTSHGWMLAHPLILNPT
jgi:hypothetical protein